jgi:RpiR family carbohydrate utilization transcriptional regulator
MAVYAKIRSIYPNLPKAEQKVAEYVLGAPRDVLLHSVYEVADAARVSVASVSRFVRTVGYGSFKEFKVELAQDRSSVAPDIYGAITSEDGELDIVNKVFRGNIQSLEDTLKMLDMDVFKEVARVFSQTRRILFLGIGGSGNVARDAALRFSLIDVQSEVYTDPLYIIVAAKRLRSGEVAVGISHSGRSAITVNALKIAREGGAHTVGVSNYLRSPLSDCADHFICTSFFESKVKVAALSSRLAQLCVFDALYLLVAYHRRKIWDIEALNSITERLLRIEG